MRTVFGLTGGIASGKSTVGKFFAEQGVHVLDADQLSREVMEPGEACYYEISNIFGVNFLTGDGHIDRKKLGEFVFKGKNPLLRTLEQIQWKHIQQRFVDKSLALDGLICYEASQIVESGQWAQFRPLVVVEIDPELQLQRLMARSGFTEEYARVRLASQSPGRAVAHADYLIRNDSDVEHLRGQALDFLEAREFLDRCRSGDAHIY